MEVVLLNGIYYHKAGEGPACRFESCSINSEAVGLLPVVVPFNGGTEFTLTEAV